jgi:hypothetical protein
VLDARFCIAAPFAGLAMMADASWWGLADDPGGCLEDRRGATVRRVVLGSWLQLDLGARSALPCEPAALADSPKAGMLVAPLGTAAPGERMLLILEHREARTPPLLRGLLSDSRGQWRAITGERITLPPAWAPPDVLAPEQLIPTDWPPEKRRAAEAARANRTVATGTCDGYEWVWVAERGGVRHLSLSRQRTEPVHPSPVYVLHADPEVSAGGE